MTEPVLSGFFPDPSVCRVGAEFFLANSSFEYFPGVPLHRSRDLLHWTPVGHALDRPDRLQLAHAPSSGGIYAPTLRHRDGLFWLITTDATGRGHLIVTAREAGGPWSAPVWVDGAPGIDPDLAWDRDGTCRLTYSAGGVGRSGAIMQARIDPAEGRLLESPRRIWSGTGLQFPEAPHLYSIGGTWYLVIAEGGTERGHAVSVARGPAPDGPFEGCPANPVLSHRSTGHPVQNTGHADLVEGPDGKWWALLHGARPRGMSPGFHVLGRETFLAPVRWEDGWPRLGPLHDGPASRGTVVARTDFRTAPGAEWVSVRRPVAGCGAGPGGLVLPGDGATLDDPLPAFVARRQQHLECRIRARLSVRGGTGGLAIRLDERHHCELEADGRRVRAQARIGPLRQTIAAVPARSGSVVLRVEVAPGSGDAVLEDGGAPDLIRLGLEQAGGVRWLAELDGRYLSTEVAGGFTGRVLGVYAVSGVVTCDWFEYQGGRAAARP